MPRKSKKPKTKEEIAESLAKQLILGGKGRLGLVEKVRREQMREKIKAAKRAKGHKLRRARPGTNALREIKRYQQSTELLMRKATMARYIKKCAKGKRIQGAANIAMQEAAESFAVELWKQANLVAVNSHRATVQPKDILLVQRNCTKWTYPSHTVNNEMYDHPVRTYYGTAVKK